MTLTDFQVPLFFIGITLAYLTVVLAVYDKLIDREDLYKKMPSMPKMSGRMITAPVSNTSVRKNEMSAETSPLLSAVNRDDAYIEKPMNKKQSAYIL